MSKLFAMTINQSAVSIARESIEVGVNDDGIPVVSVAFARGKGTGKQEIPVADFPAVIEALDGYAVNGLNRTAKALSPVDMLHATIGLNEDNRVQFRVGQGKGAKPTSLNTDELSAVVGFLREVLPVVEKAAKGLKK
jgi:hypothetical protein